MANKELTLVDAQRELGQEIEAVELGKWAKDAEPYTMFIAPGGGIYMVDGVVEDDGGVGVLAQVEGWARRTITGKDGKAMHDDEGLRLVEVKLRRDVWHPKVLIHPLPKGYKPRYRKQIHEVYRVVEEGTD